MLRWLLFLGVMLAVGGCQRPWYRRSADRQSYAVEREHEDEARWPVANTCITPPRGSRLFDPFNPDYPPMPPDDAAANYYMRHPDGQPPPRTYHRDGDAPWIEDPSWRQSLVLDKDGALVLTPEKAVETGLLHSREYQTALEILYIAALTLTLNRFDFAMHWYAINNTMMTWFGAGETAERTVNVSNDVGFTRNLAAGGQLIVDFANSFVFTFGGVNQATATSNLTATLFQPLLRGAGRRIRLETLTQGERNTLYAVRSFAALSGAVLRQLDFGQRRVSQPAVSSAGHSQSGVQPQKPGAKSTASRSAVRHRHGVDGRGGSSVPVLSTSAAQRDPSEELFGDVAGQLQANVGFAPDLPIKLDDSILQPFQLASPQLEALQGELDRFFAGYRELDKAPAVPSLKGGFKQLQAFHERLVLLTTEVEAELAKWRRLPPEMEDESAIETVGGDSHDIGAADARVSFGLGQNRQKAPERRGLGRRGHARSRTG